MHREKTLERWRQAGVMLPQAKQGLEHWKLEEAGGTLLQVSGRGKTLLTSLFLNFWTPELHEDNRSYSPSPLRSQHPSETSYLLRPALFVVLKGK